jgi:hypothetical protein
LGSVCWWRPRSAHRRLAHRDRLILRDPASCARLPKIHQDETRTQGLDRLELIRFLQVAPTTGQAFAGSGLLLVAADRLRGVRIAC